MTLTVNGETIDENVLEQEFANIKASYEQLNPFAGCCERDDEFRGYAEQNIVGRVLLVQESERQIDTITDEEVERALADLIEQHGGKEQFYVASGVGPDQDDAIRRDLAMNLRVTRLLEQVCADIAEPTDEDLRKFYDEHIDEYMTKERVRASHILRAPSRGEDRAAAYDQMRQTRRRLLDGEDFRAVAEEISDKVRELKEADAEERAKAGDPIDLGWFSRGELMEEFELVAFSMNVNEISPVFGSAFGFHLVTVTDREESRPQPLDEIRDTVRDNYLNDRRTHRVNDYVKGLEAQATIERSENEEGCGPGCGCGHEH